MANNYEEPHTEWVHETSHDTLVVYLPGYKKERLKVQVTTTGKLRISGERLVGENESTRFRQEFPIPAYCDGNGISATFKGGILNIKLPKFNAPVAEKPKPLSPEEDHEKAEKEMQKLDKEEFQDAQEKPEIQEKTNDASSHEEKEMGMNDGNGKVGAEEGRRGAGEMNYRGVHGRTPGAGDVKQVLDGLVMEYRNPRKVWNLMVALFMVMVLGLYVRQAYLSLFGGFDSEK